MPNYQRRIVYLSEAQREELFSNGSITVNGTTITYDANDMYVTPQEEPYVKPASGIPASDLASGVVPDVRINGTSIVSNGVANIPVPSGSGLAYDGTNLKANTASDASIKTGTSNSALLTPGRQHQAAFYGLAKAAGDATQASSSNAVGTYTDAAKTAIRTMLGAVGSTDYASTTDYGLVKIGNSSIAINPNNGGIMINTAGDAAIKAGANSAQAIVPLKQHISTFYGLAKAAGDTTQASSDNAVGTYTDDAKTAIQTMLDVVSKPSLDNAGIMSKTYTMKFGGQFSVTTAIDSNFTYPRATASVTGRLYNEYMYRVTFNGTEYILPVGLVNRPAVYNPNNYTETCEYVGDIGLIQDDVSGIIYPIPDVPFAIVSCLDNSDDNHIDVFTETAGTYTIKIEQITNTQTRFPESLISGGAYPAIIRVNNPGSTYDGFSVGGGNELKNKRAALAFGYANIINGEFSASFGFGNKNSAHESLSIGTDNVVAGPTAIAFGSHNQAQKLNSVALGNSTISNATSMVAAGVCNAEASLYPTIVKNTHYYVGDKIRVGSLGYVCIEEHDATKFFFDKWQALANESDVAFAYGIGQNSSNRANAVMIDWDGNTHIKGNVYVNCNADSTGGTRLPTDIQINGTSIVSNGVANIPIASSSDAGTVKVGATMRISSSGILNFCAVGASEVKAGTTYERALTPERQHASVFYGLAKAAGADMASSSNSVGTYTDAAKTAIQMMLGVESGVSFVETVSGATPSITGEPNTRYMCGEVTSISITSPSAGTIDVIFTSGSTPSVLTVTPPTGMTMKWPAWFDPTSLATNTTYEINIMDGVYGAVMAW